VKSEPIFEPQWGRKFLFISDSFDSDDFGIIEPFDISPFLFSISGFLFLNFIDSFFICLGCLTKNKVNKPINNKDEIKVKEAPKKPSSMITPTKNRRRKAGIKKNSQIPFEILMAFLSINRLAVAKPINEIDRALIIPIQNANVHSNMARRK